MSENTNPGVLLDTRPPEAQAKDFLFEELVSSTAPVNWTEKKPDVWRRFPIFDQDGSGSCVAQTLKKMMGVYVWLKTKTFLAFSASHIYQRRVNKPAGGMGGDDVFKIGQQGVTLEQFAPSENMTDAQMDAVQVNEFMRQVGLVFKLGNYMRVNSVGNIDTVASIIQETGKAVMVWFYFSSGLKPREWVVVPEVRHQIDLRGSTTARHSIAAVDFTTLGKNNLPKAYSKYYGKRALICDESWGLDKDVQDWAKITDSFITYRGQHIITEDFFKARNFFIGHFMNFAFEDGTADPATPKPAYTFTRELEFSATVQYDTDVKALQDILKYEGLFPTNVESTGYFGAVTQRAVEQYQMRYGIAAPGSAGYGRVGPRTMAHLNSKY